MKKGLFSLALIAVFFTGVFVGRVLVPSVQEINMIANPELEKPAAVDFSLFWDVWHLLENKYVDRDELPVQEMVYGAIEGMVKSLNDPYTVFMPPAETKQFQEDMQGQFSGIGAEIGIRKEILTIIAPLEGSPAKMAGLRSGDRILKINDEITTDMALDEAVRKIRGPQGEAVVLTVLKEGSDKPEEIKIIRDVIKLPIIKYETKEDNIAYVSIYHFAENVTAEFEAVAGEILKSNVKGIVLDLRGNPGGYLESAVDIAGWFVGDGKVVVSEEFGDGAKREHKSKGGSGRLSQYPVVVLVDGGSASASEILAGALRDLRKAKLVGTKTFGKGSVQQLESLLGGGSLKVTIAKWLTPAGHDINKEGLAPDQTIEPTEENIQNNEDVQLNKALELLKEQVK